MLEAESGLGQNMPVVGNGVNYLPKKFQLNRSTVACEMTKIRLTAQRTVLGTVFCFPLRCHILILKMQELDVNVFIRNVVLCLSFETV